MIWMIPNVSKANPGRWCQNVCTVHPGQVEIPLKVTNTQGDEVEVMECPTNILWPWEILHWLWESGNFLQWVADDPDTAGDRVKEYWNHCSHLDFYKRLELSPSQHRTTVPVFFHADGVKVYKSQKAWVYSFSSACRKGPSIRTKLVIILLRENRIIKEASHDAVGKLIGYIMDTLMTPMEHVLMEHVLIRGHQNKPEQVTKFVEVGHCVLLALRVTVKPSTSFTSPKGFTMQLTYATTAWHPGIRTLLLEISGCRPIA